MRAFLAFGDQLPTGVHNLPTADAVGGRRKAVAIASAASDSTSDVVW